MNEEMRYFLYAATTVMAVSLGILVYWTAKHGKSVQTTEREKEGDLPKITNDGR